MARAVSTHERPNGNVRRRLEPFEAVCETPTDEDLAGASFGANSIDVFAQQIPRRTGAIGDNESGGVVQPKTFFAMTIRWIWFVPS